MKLLLTAFTTRCLLHWLPIAPAVRAAGGQCELMLYPRRCDPDHAGLLRLEEPVACLLPIDWAGRFEAPEAEAEAVMRAALRRGRYDAVLMTSCNFGPDHRVRALLRDESPGTLAIGLQHGFAQDWADYARDFAAFDRFGVFGPAFLPCFPPALRPQIVPLALPRLDLLPRLAPVPDGPVLVALQDRVPVEIWGRVAEGFARQGRQVLFRTHPEHPALYDALRGRFAFADPAEPLSKALGRCAALVSTGSTSVVEALECGIPAAVIPDHHGTDYAPFGIVAAEASAAALEAVLARFAEPGFSATVEERMRACTGPRGARVRAVLDGLAAVLG